MSAMALLCRPKLLIADEPTTALDVIVQKKILDLIKDLQKQYNMGVIYITHDLGLVAEIADKIIVMYKGCIVEADGARLVCPCHGSVFEAGTGANVSGPAPTPLPEFAVTVTDGQVVEA